MNEVDFTDFSFNRSRDSNLNQIQRKTKGEKLEPVIEMKISPVAENF